jgi:hypothetical protein
MRRRSTRAAAAVTALVAGGLAVFALRPTPTKTATLAAANQPAEVRTVVIRRTVHIVKHHPIAGAGSSIRGGAGHGATVHTGPSGSHGYASAAAGAVSTHVSGSHTIAGSSATSSVVTRTSPGHGGSGSGTGSSSAPVTSRTTPHGGSHSGSGSSGGPVTSRTTPHGGSGSGSGGSVHTRTSSGGSVHTRTSGGGEKGDNGGD